MSLARRVRSPASGIGLWRKLAVALAAAALASGIATYLALTGTPPFGPRVRAVVSLLNLDLVLLLALAAIVAKRLVEVWLERRRGLAGSRLQIRLVGSVQPDRGAADDHRCGVFLPVLRLRRRIVVQRQGAHRDLRIGRGRRCLCQGAPAGDPRRCAVDGQRS